MKIPKKLKIGGHVYEVRVLHDDEKDSAFKCKDCGETEIAKSIIRIDGNQTESQQEETFIHEIFHAINNTLDHALLHSLAHSMHQVLKDNSLLSRK